MKNKQSREYLMRKWQEYSFAVYEARLYLDTHPDSTAALRYYNKFNALQNEVQNELRERYGMVSMYDAAPQNSWNWTNMPWPWTAEEGEE